METNFYSYGNIIRILNVNNDDFSKSLMIDVNLDDKTIMSIFDASRIFDCNFIRSYLNILSESSVGFRPLNNTEADTLLRQKAIEVLDINTDIDPNVGIMKSLIAK